MAALPCQGHNTYHGWEKPAWESPEGAWQSQLPALPVTVNYNNVYRQKPTIIQCELGRQFHFHAEFPLPFLHQLAASFTIRKSSLEEAAPGFKATCPPHAGTRGKTHLAVSRQLPGAMGLPLQIRERDGIVSGAELRAPPQKRAMGADGDFGGAQAFLGSVLFHPMLPSHTLTD